MRQPASLDTYSSTTDSLEFSQGDAGGSFDSGSDDDSNTVLIVAILAVAIGVVLLAVILRKLFLRARAASEENQEEVRQRPPRQPYKHSSEPIGARGFKPAATHDGERNPRSIGRQCTNHHSPYHYIACQSSIRFGFRVVVVPERNLEKEAAKYQETNAWP
ncbi:hypothetical protein JG688_00009316 [Phytophthora aleatoria]|uniref:Uncharacterized protein n=1 Tax=Phytophthora aleatoria TaxID=2496075 RepID=A0A8J5M6R2_9STRA|nr:hypothetical protein JG688_00009316 [Phytophthora aleatoria]